MVAFKNRYYYNKNINVSEKVNYYINFRSWEKNLNIKIYNYCLMNTIKEKKTIKDTTKIKDKHKIWKI